jgi:hypothetical protein
MATAIHNDKLMRLITGVFVYVCLLILPFNAFSQAVNSAEKILNAEQTSFLIQLKNSSIDSAFSNPISRFAETEFKNISIKLTAYDGEKKDKAARSMAYFIRELGKDLSSQRIIIYEVPGCIKAYKGILTAILEHRPFMSILEPLRSDVCQLMATSLSQYKESSSIDDIAVYKRISASPSYILQFLESKPGFRYADSLINIAAANNPQKFLVYLKNSNQALRGKIRLTNNPYLKQIIALSDDRNVSELLPFVMPLTDGRLTTDEILEKRKDVVQYYQLLVNTLQDQLASSDSTSLFLQLVRNGIKEKSLSFYANQVNDLHNSADPIRFASVKGLRPQDLYYIITSCGEELYTSSYLGLYKRLMGHFQPEGADSLFHIVKNDQFRVFMRMAANYNTLTDFLGRMTSENRNTIVKKFIYGIERDTDTGLYKAMDIADSFTGLGVSPVIGEQFQDELQLNLSRCKSNQHYYGIRLYSILLQVFDLVSHNNSLNKLWASLGNYELLKQSSLRNKQGEIIELTLFYGDEDGEASYNSFLKLYADTSKWKIEKNNNWVSINSVAGVPLKIFANNPLEPELDLRAQDSLVMYLSSKSMEPTVLIHRGHSYHLDKTLKHLRPSVKLAILGSCGGYNNSISIAAINPDVQIIASKKTGAKSINDPIIDIINQTLLSGNDLVWPTIWKELSDRFSKDESTLNMFNEYIPPSKNVSLFVLKLFVLYNRFA